MAKSEEGELEFILGNKQLLLVFMTVVVLLAVFFSMGYILGRNSVASAETARNTSKSVAVESPPADSQPSDTNPQPAVQESPPIPSKVVPPAGPETTHPEQPAPAKPSPAPSKPSPLAETKPKPAPVGPPAEPQAAVKTPASSAGRPAPGQYWQVVATSRPDAEIISEALTRKGFHTVITPASREGFFRVLVGPYSDAAAHAQARTSLEAAGFKHPITQKY